MTAGGGRSLGLDVGERRIGVAIADELGLIASPLGVVARRKGDLAEILQIAQVRGVNRIVVGMPTGMSGREGPQAASVRLFAEELMAVSGKIAVSFWDERLTTAVAERAMRERGGKKDRRKGDVDAIAASVILQGFLDAQRMRNHARPAPQSAEAG